MFTKEKKHQPHFPSIHYTTFHSIRTHPALARPRDQKTAAIQPKTINHLPKMPSTFTTAPTLKQNLAITTTPSHTLHLREVPTPTPGANECLIHVRATGICGSDVHFWKEGGIGDSKVQGELGLGHESAGVIVGFGEGAEGWRVGELFFLFFFLSMFSLLILPVVVRC